MVTVTLSGLKVASSYLRGQEDNNFGLSDYPVMIYQWFATSSSFTFIITPRRRRRSTPIRRQVTGLALQVKKSSLAFFNEHCGGDKKVGVWYVISTSSFNHSLAPNRCHLNEWMRCTLCVSAKKLTKKTTLNGAASYPWFRELNIYYWRTHFDAFSSRSIFFAFIKSNTYHYQFPGAALSIKDISFIHAIIALVFVCYALLQHAKCVRIR